MAQLICIGMVDEWKESVMICGFDLILTGIQGVTMRTRWLILGVKRPAMNARKSTANNKLRKIMICSI